MSICVGVAGAAGRMGKTLIAMIAAAPEFHLGAALEDATSSALGADAGELAGAGLLGVVVTPELAETAEELDVLVDFSVPAATLSQLAPCCAAHVKLVIGTTGFDAAGQAQIEAAAERTAILKSPNMSVGVNVAFGLIELAARVLGDDVDVEVIEAHHRDKIDAPSGTAVRMGEILAATLGRDLAEDAIYGRHGTTGRRQARTSGFSAVRGGDIVGEHTVLFAGAGERLEVTHRAQSRANFAAGALRAARFVAAKERGLYDMHDVLGFPAPGVGARK